MLLQRAAFHSPHPRGDTHPSLTPIPGDLVSFPGLQGQCTCTWQRYICAAQTSAHIKPKPIFLESGLPYFSISTFQRMSRRHTITYTTFPHGRKREESLWIVYTIINTYQWYQCDVQWKDRTTTEETSYTKTCSVPLDFLSVCNI